MVALSFILAWLSFGGFGNAWLILSNDALGLPSEFGYIALVYGLSAGATAFGFWRMRPWSKVTFRAWAVTCVGGQLEFARVSEAFSDRIDGFGVAVAFFLLFVLFVLWRLNRYAVKIISRQSVQSRA